VHAYEGKAEGRHGVIIF